MIEQYLFTHLTDLTWPFHM